MIVAVQLFYGVGSCPVLCCIHNKDGVTSQCSPFYGSSQLSANSGFEGCKPIERSYSHWNWWHGATDRLSVSTQFLLNRQSCGRTNGENTMTRPSVNYHHRSHWFGTESNFLYSFRLINNAGCHGVVSRVTVTVAVKLCDNSVQNTSVPERPELRP